MLQIYFIFISLYSLLGTFMTSIICANKNEKSGKTQYNHYRYIEKKIDLIKQQCGSLCEIHFEHAVPMSDKSLYYYEPIEKDVNCKTLWNSSIFDESSGFKEPIQKLPTYLQKYFSYNNTVDIKPYYFDQNEIDLRNHTFNTWGMISFCYSN